MSFRANSHGQEIFVPVLEENDSQYNRVYFTMTCNQGVSLTLAEIGKLSGVEREGSVASRLREMRTAGAEIVRTTSPGNAKVFEYTFMGWQF